MRHANPLLSCIFGSILSVFAGIPLYMREEFNWLHQIIPTKALWLFCGLGVLFLANIIIATVITARRGKHNTLKKLIPRYWAIALVSGLVLSVILGSIVGWDKPSKKEEIDLFILIALVSGTMALCGVFTHLCLLLTKSSPLDPSDEM